MTSEVSSFLNDSIGNFTESAPRPPVPGEENDLSSCGGSTRSSGSHRNKSLNSSSSTLRADHSPAATPRRSNLDRHNWSSGGGSFRRDGCDEEAPLGFEPEGSVSSSPRFTENGTPPYLKWAQNLTNLLEDGEGVKLFKQFLDQENCSNQLEFWFACQGFKMSAGDTRTQAQLVRVIYRKYIKGDVLPNLAPEIKRRIMERVREYDQTIFDDAQAEVETCMRNDSYPLFLKSDLYVQYIQTGGDSPKTSNNSSGSSSARPLSGPLPTLNEDEMLRPEDVKSSANTSAVPLSLTPSALRATRDLRQQTSRSKLEASYLHHAHTGSRHAVNPYHTSYAPVSAQDSELQSLSSDALTDDTMSLTDSSVDGREVGGKKWKRKAMQRSAQLNKDKDINNPFIPRTDRAAPKDRNIAETDPKQFAALLTEKLEKVLADLASSAKVLDTLKLCETDEEDRRSMGSGSRQQVNTSVKGDLGVLLTSMTSQDDENAQSILEEHCSRIWDSSEGQTPGHHSPKTRSPDRSFRLDFRSQLAGPSPNVSASSVFNRSHHKRKEKEPHLTSLQSFDSGMGEDKSGVYNKDHKYSHHHHVPKDSLQYYRTAAQDTSLRSRSEMHGLNQSWDEQNLRGRNREAKRTNPKKCSDSSSMIDSGVSGLYEPTNHPVMPNLHDPAKEKVLEWMRQNEGVAQPRSTQYSTDNSDRSSTSHKRSSHKSSIGTPAPHRQSKNKQGVYGSRSTSLDRSLPLMPGPDFSYGGSSGSVQPSQPFLLDPSMPMLPGPNTTTQLEEARRRLEDQQAERQKSRSFMGSSKERRTNMPPPGSLPPRSLNLHSNTSFDMSTSVDDSSMRSDRYSSAPPPKPSASAPSTPADNETTVVGYYFCSEPIPYRTTIRGKRVTLGQFKQHISKRGIYRYFFKKESDEFDSGAIFEEVSVDEEILPLWDGKIVGKVDKVE